MDDPDYEEIRARLDRIEARQTVLGPSLYLVLAISFLGSGHFVSSLALGIIWVIAEYRWRRLEPRRRREPVADPEAWRRLSPGALIHTDRSGPRDDEPLS